MKKPGRPRKVEKRSFRIGLSLSEEEYSRIRTKAEEAKITASDFAYRAVTKKEIVVPIQANYELIRELNAIGRNVNLIAKKSIVEQTDLKIISEYLDEIREIKNRLLN